MTRAVLVALLLVACGSSRAPLPLPAAARSWVGPLPTPSDDRARLAAPEPPSIVSFTLPSGLSVQIAEQHAVPVVYAALVGRGSPSDASVELDALIEIALGGDLAAEDLEPATEEDTARVSERGLVLTSRIVPAELDGVLVRYAGVLEGRALTGERFAHARAAVLGRARFTHDQRLRRGVTPEEDLFTRLYGEGHDRVRRMRMRPRVIERIDEARARRQLASLLVPARSALVIVGDVDAATVGQAVRQRFSSLVRAELATSRERASPTFSDPATRLRIHGTRDEPSALVRLIERGPPIEHEDYAAFRLFARLAGGMFSSGLNLRLRETRGDAYGVMTDVSDRVDHSILQIAVVVPVASASSAASAIVAELARLSDASRIEAEELEIARSVELAELAAALETSTGLGRALAAAFLAGQPPSSIADTFARVAELDAEAVATVGRRWIRPDKAPMIIVGDSLWLFTHPVRVPGGVDFAD